MRCYFDRTLLLFYMCTCFCSPDRTTGLLIGSIDMLAPRTVSLAVSHQLPDPPKSRLPRTRFQLQFQLVMKCGLREKSLLVDTHEYLHEQLLLQYYSDP